MSISLTITASDPSDLRRKLADMLGSVGGAKIAITASPIAFERVDPRTTARPAPKFTIIDEGNPGEDAPEPESEGQHPEPEAAVAEVYIYDYATEIKPMVLRISAKFGREGVVSLLAPYNVANAQLIPDAKHAELMATAEQMLEEAA